MRDLTTEISLETGPSLGAVQEGFLNELALGPAGSPHRSGPHKPKTGRGCEGERFRVEREDGGSVTQTAGQWPLPASSPTDHSLSALRWGPSKPRPSPSER